jgi:hypothetical protein
MQGAAQAVASAVQNSFAVDLAVTMGFLSDIVDGSLLIHIYSDSSKGKTTGSALAISTAGNPSSTTKKRSLQIDWGDTYNYRVASLSGNFGVPIVLDEASKIATKDISSFIYSCCNGVSKGRLSSDGTQKDVSHWSTCTISNGEGSLLPFCNNNQDIRARLIEVCFDSITENFSDNEEGHLMTNIQQAMSEYYSLNLAREVRKGMDIVASKGLHTGGTAPLGYNVGEDRKLHINESEAEIVRMIFDMYANGHSYNDIAHEMNARGYKTKIGKEFTVASFHSILSNRKYVGEYVYNKIVAKDMLGKHNSHKQKSEEEIVRIPNGVPQIVSTQTFEKVQERLEMNKKKTVSYKPNSTYLLTGLVICGECGYHFQGNSRAAGRGNNSIYSSFAVAKGKITNGAAKMEKLRKTSSKISS